MKPLIIFQVILLLTAPLFGDVINLGELSREERGQALFVDVVSSNGEINSLARRAFGSHGGYQLASAEEDKHFTFRMEQEGAHEISLSIESGRPAQVQYQQKIRGNTLSDAILKASDLAVEKTLGKPGFFAGKLTFVGERGGKKDLYTSDLFFNHVRQLTHDGVDIVAPRWSADGKKIIYTSYYKTGFPDIFVVDLAKNERNTVAAYTGTNVGGVFNPAGDKIAMVLSSSGNSELYTANASGLNPKRLTTTKSLESAPAWSPDGRKIFFSSDDLGSPQVYVINAEGGTMHRIPTNISRYCDEPAPNPLNRNLLAFTAAVSKTFQIALYNFEEKKSTFVTEGKDDHLEPFWLDDGRHLVVTMRNKGIHQLYILDSETRKRSRLHSPEFGNSSMASFVYLR